VTADNRQALSFFLPGIAINQLEPLGEGNVNDTWLTVSGTGDKYVLQRLNPDVFASPSLVQDNLSTVTSFLRLQLEKINTDFTVFQVQRSPEGFAGYVAPDGTWWRLLTYIDNSRVLNTVSTPAQAREIGHALGLFHHLTSSLPSAFLNDPLPGFHVTPLYLEQYDTVRQTADNGVADCRDFIEERRADVSLLENARKQETIRVRIIHGDPKVANFLFSEDLSRVISLIDLDTVKPGLLLHDLGDCLRSCCNPAGEEIRTPGKVIFDQELFAAMLKGYFHLGADILTPAEKTLIVDSVRLISFELGLRFYTDYLAGNRYFKVHYPDHNLFRTRIQFALVRSIEAQYSELVKICAACR
jgi:Ser/Thr protein kinase RdoA (MazF antagonist)